MSLFRTIAFAACAMTFALPAHSATHNVPGSFGTIQAAVTAAAPGDSVLVAMGTYNENVTIDKNVALLSVSGRALTTVTGISSAGALGTIQVTSNTTACTIGDTGQGFTIVGIDNGLPGIENAAVYFQGSHSDARIIDNEIVAAGDHGLLTEFGATISGFVIDGNEFSGATFLGLPSGEGFAMQFTLPNVPRQLIVMGGGGGGGNTSNTTFTNNMVTGTAGGLNGSGAEQGNNLATIDSNGATITGNTFNGTTSRFATSFRARGPSTTISGNVFDSAGIQFPLALTGHVFLQNTGETAATVAAANTFDKCAYVDGVIATLTWAIQPTVSLVPSGTTVNVLPGTYVEQIIITTDIVLQGSGRASTFIHAPAALASTFTTSASNRPVVTVLGTGDAEVRDFTIDGLGNGNANNRFHGVAFYNGGGALLDCDIVDIRDTPASGVQHGIGIYAFNDGTGAPYALEVGGCDVNGFQKNAMALSGDDLTVDVHDCDVVGAGDIAYTAQNGIQVSFGAGGSVTNCSVSDMRYTPASTVASGLLMYLGTTINVSGCTLVDAQEAVYFQDVAGSIDGIDISFVSSAPDYDGIFVYNTTTARSAEPRVVAAPVEESYSRQSALLAPITVSISNGCLTGTGASATTGIYAASTSSALTVNVSNMTVSSWDYGMIADGGAVALTAVDCSISGNTTAGYDNTLSGASQTANFNWWGAADGPSGDGSGSGDAVLSVGGEVTFASYRTSGLSSTTCAFSPTDNTVTPTPPTDCISTNNPCVTVPFDIARSDAANMRGFSVTFTLSPELELCSGIGSITEGTYLNAIGGTTFFALDNGGGSYTVDGSILGSPCGQTAATGTLFEVAVKSAGSDGTGTITITSILLRNCVNVPLPAAAGTPASVTIDETVPVAVGNLTATQVLSGNDSDGTTKTTIAFTAPGDATSVQVWRKGFGDYPEYDDGSGIAPTAPTDPANALANGWTLTGVTATGQTDEAAVRDYWYYVMFSEDACTNVSPVSNQTLGTLGYHLGDVSDGITPGQGENLVATADVSLLGANYGITVTFGSLFNYLDVGPTTTNFVDGRPQTDDVVNFEDLMMFAINFGQVSRQPVLPQAEFIEPGLALVIDDATGAPDRILARLVLANEANVVKGIHSVVSFDDAALELVGVRQGALLDRASGPVFFKSLDHEKGVLVDAAIFGTDRVLEGSGEIAVLEFRVRGAGRPVLDDVALRDAHNRIPGTRTEPVVAQLPANEDEASIARGLPTRLELVGARPNPFANSTDISFRIPSTTQVSVTVYDVAGRLIRTLVDRTVEPGEVTVTWDGRSDDGRLAGAGVYFYVFQAQDKRETRKLLRIR